MPQLCNRLASSGLRVCVLAEDVCLCCKMFVISGLLHFYEKFQTMEFYRPFFKIELNNEM